MANIYETEVETIDHRREKLAAYRDNVLLVVNVASKCGFTPQYAALEALYRKYRERHFLVLGFPCDQFGNQEPGDEAEIQRFCSLHYDVTFPLFAKISVNGPATHPLYQQLKSSRRGFLGTRRIKWNFTKFLIDRGGAVVKRYGPTTTPQRIERDIEHLLP